MADKALDTLYIAYKSSGIDKVRKDLREILSTVKETQRKINALLRGVEAPFKRLESASLAISKIQSRFAKQLESATANYKEQEKSLKQISNLTKGLKGAKITVKYERPKERAAGEGGDQDRVHSPRGDTVSDNSSNGGSSFHIGVALRRLIGALAFPGVLVKAADTIVKQNNEQRKANQQFYNAIRFSGLSARAATNAAANVQRYGGDAGNVLASSNSISASLGALSRGDTSLIEHLGRFGIGGIMPNMTPEQVQNIIKRRLASGQLNANEVNALFAGLPYSNAEKISMLEGNDLYKGNLKAFQIEEENRNVLYEGARAQISLAQKFEEFLKSPYITEAESFYQKMKAEYPVFFAAIDRLNAVLAELSPILTSLLAVLGAKKLAGGVKGAGGAKGAGNKFLLAAKNPLTYGAALTAFVGWEGYKAMKNAAEVSKKIDPKMSLKDFKNRDFDFQKDVDYLRYKRLSPQEFFEKHPEILEDEQWMKIYNRSPLMNRGYFPQAPQSAQPTAMNVTINVNSMDEAFNAMADLQQRGVYNINFMESALI